MRRAARRGVASREACSPDDRRRALRRCVNDRKTDVLLRRCVRDIADADADYETVKALHKAGIIGSCDSAIVTRESDGKLKIAKTEKPTQHGGWLGLAAGAATALAAPVAMPGVVAAGGAGLGAWIGHLARSLSRSDVRELGETLDEGTTALLVIGVNRDADRVQKQPLRPAGIRQSESKATTRKPSMRRWRSWSPERVDLCAS